MFRVHCRDSRGVSVHLDEIKISVSLLGTFGGVGDLFGVCSLANTGNRYCLTVPQHYFRSGSCKQSLQVTGGLWRVTDENGETRERNMSMQCAPQLSSQVDQGRETESSILSSKELLSEEDGSSLDDFSVLIESDVAIRRLEFQLKFVFQINQSSVIHNKLIVTNEWSLQTSVKYTANISKVCPLRVSCIEGTSGTELSEGDREVVLGYTQTRQGMSGQQRLVYALDMQGNECVAVAAEMDPIPSQFDSPGKVVLAIDSANLISPDSSAPSQEFVFLVDCSGSMSGHNITEAVHAIQVALRCLPTRSYFNVVAFGSKYRHLYLRSERYTQKSLDEASLFVSRLEAILGGTELCQPLKWVLRQRCASRGGRHIVIITDGETGRAREIIKLALVHRDTTQFHVLGLGKEVGCRLLRTLVATTGDGEAFFLERAEELPVKMVSILHHIIYSTCPSLVDVDIPGWKVVGESGTLHPSLLTIIPRSASHSFPLPSSGSVRIPHSALNQSLVVKSFPSSSKEADILSQLASWRTMEYVLRQYFIRKDPKLMEEALSISKGVGIRCPFSNFKVDNADGVLEVTVVPHFSSLQKGTRASVPLFPQSRKRRHRERHGSGSFLRYWRDKAHSLYGSVRSTVCSLLGLENSSDGILDDDDDTEGYSLDDIETEQREERGIHWNRKGELVYPSIYYKTERSSGEDDSSPPVQPKSKRLRVEDPSTDEEDSSDALPQADEIIAEETAPKVVPSISPVFPPKDFWSLLKLQRANGTWSLSDGFLWIAGLSKEQMASVEEQLQINRTQSDDGCLLATLVAMVCLSLYFGEREDIWRLCHKKAANHAKGLTNKSFDSLILKLSQIFKQF